MHGSHCARSKAPYLARFSAVLQGCYSARLPHFAGDCCIGTCAALPILLSTDDSQGMQLPSCFVKCNMVNRKLQEPGNPALCNCPPDAGFHDNRGVHISLAVQQVFNWRWQLDCKRAMHGASALCIAFSARLHCLKHHTLQLASEPKT